MVVDINISMLNIADIFLYGRRIVKRICGFISSYSAFLYLMMVCASKIYPGSLQTHWSFTSPDFLLQQAAF